METAKLDLGSRAVIDFSGAVAGGRSGLPTFRDGPLNDRIAPTCRSAVTVIPGKRTQPSAAFLPVAMSEKQPFPNRASP